MARLAIVLGISGCAVGNKGNAVTKLLLVYFVLLSVDMYGYSISEPCGVGIACGVCVTALQDPSPWVGLALYCVGYASDNVMLRFTGIPALMRGAGLGILVGHAVGVLYTRYRGKKPSNSDEKKQDAAPVIFADDF